MKAVGYFLLNTVQLVFLCVYSLVLMTVALIVAIFSGEATLWMARHMWSPGLIWISRARVEIVPGAKLGKGPYVFLMNHQSMVDIPFAFAYIPINIRFVAKKVLQKVPFLGWYMRSAKMIFVDRRDRAQALASLEEAGRRIREGASILAYPEGTRSTAGEILPFKKGPFNVALAAGVPIVPVVVDGTGTLLPRGGFKVRPCLVRMTIGEPIPTHGLGQKDIEPLMRRVRDAMIDLHLEIGGQGGDRDDAIAAPGQEGIGRPVAKVRRAA